MFNSLKNFRNNLEITKVISREDVAKLETITQDRFITESISLDKFPKTKTTLYVNDVKNLIDRKIFEYNNYNNDYNRCKDLYTQTIENIKYLEDFKQNWKTLYPLFDFLNKVEFAEYNESTDTYSKISEESSITDQLTNPKFLNAYPQFSNSSILSDEEDIDIKGNKYDSMLMYLINHYNKNVNPEEDIKIHYVLSYKMSIKDFRKYCVEDKDLIYKSIDSLKKSLIDTTKALFNPMSITNYKDTINNGLNIIESLNKHKDKFYFYKIAQNMINDI